MVTKRTHVGSVKPLVLAAPLLAIALSGCMVGGSASSKPVATPARVAAVAPTATPQPDPGLVGVAARLVAVRTIAGEGVGLLQAGVGAQSQQLPDTARIDFADALAQFQIAERLLRGLQAVALYGPSARDLRTAIGRYLAATEAYTRGRTAAETDAVNAARSLAKVDRELGVRPEMRLASVAAAAQAIVTKQERVKPHMVKASPHRILAHRSSHSPPAVAGARTRPTPGTRFAIVTPTILPTRTPAPTSTPVPAIAPTATPKPTARPRPLAHPRPVQPADAPSSVLAAQAVAQATMQALAHGVTISLPVTEPAFTAARRASRRLRLSVSLLRALRSTHDPRVQARLDETHTLADADLTAVAQGLAGLSTHSPQASRLVRAATALERRVSWLLQSAESDAQTGAPGSGAQFDALLRRARVRIAAANRDLRAAKAILTA